MNKQLRKVLSIAAGIVFIAFLALLPQILIRGTVGSVRVAVKLKNIAEKKNEKRPPLASIEPIEKENFFHFLPGAKTYALEDADLDFAPGSSVATSLRTPAEVVTEAKSYGAVIIFSACSQGTSSWDYSLALARLAKQNNLKSVFSCNGCMGNDFFKKIIPFLDAAKIEFGDTEIKYCTKISPTYFDTVMENISAAKIAGLPLEISYFIDPAGSDNENKIKTAIADLKKTAGLEAVIHFLPAENATSTEIVKKARDWARQAGFKYVYDDGTNDSEGETTFCADGSIALKRQNGFMLQNNLKNGVCADGTVIPGVWK
jgi:pyruvate formate lyase activating enzyme